MYREIKISQYTDVLLDRLPNGVFLTAKTADDVNTMIIGWGHIGVVWGKYVLVVYVRYSRYTFNLIEEAKEFTVSVPIEADLRKEIAFCGQESGRDYNKFAQCRLTAVPGRIITSPIIGECELHFECKVIYQSALDPDLISPEVDRRYYDNRDYHTVYYGEIVDSYLYTK